MSSIREGDEGKVIFERPRFKKKPLLNIPSLRSSIFSEKRLEDLSSIERAIIEKWNRSLDDLSVWSDFPRVSKNIKCYDATLTPVDFGLSPKRRSLVLAEAEAALRDMEKKAEGQSKDKEETKEENVPNGKEDKILHSSPVWNSDKNEKKEKEDQEVSSFHPSGESESSPQISTRRDLPLNLLKLKKRLLIEEISEGSSSETKTEHMKEILQTFAYLLNEHDEFLKLDRNFLDHVKDELDVRHHLGEYFRKFSNPDSKTWKILKVINQSGTSLTRVTLNDSDGTSLHLNSKSIRSCRHANH